MSHQPERKEKNCLNCGTTVVGRYCHVCGQENLEPKENLWHLTSHFFNDITHFDGKFFTTLKDIILKPGFLSKEYMLGKRTSYLNPVRMYIFTSAIFFLIFFSFLHTRNDLHIEITINGKTIEQINKMDSASFAKFTARINEKDGKRAIPMTRTEFKKYSDSALPASGIHFSNSQYKSKKEYDSLFAAGAKKHNWLERKLIYKYIELNEKYHNNSKEILNALSTTLLHSLPQMLFVSLPFLALILKLLYIRRKQFYYVSHFIFSIHLYVFLFIAILVMLCVSKLNDALNWRVLSFFYTLLGFGLFVYSYLALKNFYQQGWAKTLAKFLLLVFLFFIMIGLLFVILVFFSFFKI